MALPVACVCGHEWPDLTGFEGIVVSCPKCANKLRVPGKPATAAIPAPAPVHVSEPAPEPAEPASDTTEETASPHGSGRHNAFGSTAGSRTVQSPNADKFKGLAPPKMAWKAKPKAAVQEDQKDTRLICRKQLGHLTLLLRTDPKYQSRAMELLQFVSELVNAEGDYPEDFRFVFNWFVLGVQPRVDERILCAPNFSRNPFDDLIDDLTKVFDVTAAQQEAVDLAQVRKPMPSLFTDEIRVARGCLDYKLVRLFRKDFPAPGKSGWQVGPGDPADIKRVEADPRRWEVMPAFRLLDLRPKLVNYLLMPVGFQVDFDGEHVRQIVNANGSIAWSPKAITEDGPQEDS
ncbi:MAG: hypothetical protein HS116_14705 [Planctomycetes bacterium]|nr:hypothetical protein [Planctomycetota bacterium]